jgi:Tfp pilus assembly protein PilO
MMSLSGQTRFCTRAQLALSGSLLIMAAAFVFLGYLPSTQRLKTVQNSIDTKEDELRTNLNKDQILASVKQDVNRLYVQLDGAKTLPKDDDISGFANDLTRISQETQLAKPPKYTPNKSLPEKGDLFSRYGIQIEVQGNLLNVFHFIRETENLPRLTRVKSIELHADPVHAGQVTADMTMELYFSAGQQ